MIELASFCDKAWNNKYVELVIWNPLLTRKFGNGLQRAIFDEVSEKYIDCIGFGLRSEEEQEDGEEIGVFIHLPLLSRNAI